jgi:hypothetical protein
LDGPQQTPSPFSHPPESHQRLSISHMLLEREVQAFVLRTLKRIQNPSTKAALVRAKTVGLSEL